MKKKYLISFLLVLILFGFNLVCVFADNGEDEYEGGAYPDAVYKKGVQPPFSKQSFDEITVQQLTGNVELKQTDFYLKGRNGLDFALTRYYSLSDSNVYEPDSIINYRGRFNDLYTLTYLDNNYDLGAGWSFDLPFVERRGGYIYLHYGSAGTWVFYYNVDENDCYFHKDYKLKDIMLQCDSLGTYSSGGKRSAFIMKEKDGKNTYFDIDGKLLGIKDRFGNEIKFYYTTVYDSFHGINKQLLSRIVDSVGREIRITYDTANNKVTASVTDGTTTKQVVYTKARIIDKVNTNEIDIVDGEYVLDNVVDAESRKTTYTYTYKMGVFNFYHKDPYDYKYYPGIGYSEGPAENYFACLSKVTYPTGGATCFNYEISTRHCGDEGAIEEPRATGSYDLTKSGIKKDSKTYSYKSYFEINNSHDTDTSDSYDGYPYMEYYFFDEMFSDDNYVKSFVDTFKSKTTVTDNLNNSELYTYDRKALCKDILRQGTGFKNETINEYDSKKTLTMTTNRIYNPTTNQYRDKIEMFTYNEFRDLLYYWNPLAEGNRSDTANKVSYTYDPTYHLLTVKSYKKDADITHREEFGLYPDKKSVQSQKVLEYTLKSKREFVYDAYGNVTEERIYRLGSSGIPGNGYIPIYYSYTDNNTARNHQFDGLYLTRKWCVEITDADYDYVEPRNGNDAGLIDEAFKYDYFGNLIETQDRNGNVTKIEYDKLNRTKKLTNPDSTYKTWTYNNTSNTVTISDERGNQIKYGFDEFGNKKYEQDLTTNQNINSYEYDTNHRLQYEYNNNDKCLTTYTYNNDGRLKKREIKDNITGVVLYTENDTYNDCYKDTASGKSYYVTSKEVVGDSSAPTMKTTQYADLMDRVVKQERIHNENGANKTYTELITYDYVGNKIEERTARANDEGWSEPWTAKYEYNHEGKVLKVYNVNGDFITFEYNELGKVRKTTDYKGNKAATPYYMTSYYDDLGRLVSEKIPFAQTGTSSIEYSTKKYYYDRNGNLTREVTSVDKPGQSSSYTKTEYEYNNRNMLVKVIKYDNDLPVNYTQYYYDACGNAVRMYTGLNKPLTINGLDNITTNGDTNYSTTKFEYNQFNKVKKMIDPLSNIETYTYDLNGNLLEKIDRNNNKTVMVYDALGRLLDKTVYNPDNSVNASYSYQYTLTGQQKSMSGGGINSTYKYDDLGLLKTETMSNGVTKDYSYDANENRISFVLKKGTSAKQSLTYVYDKMDRLHQVLEGGQVIAEYAYDENGNRQTLAYPKNGTSVIYTYNLANKLTILNNQKGSSTISQFTYTYYLDGNQATKVDSRNGGTTSYIYDGLGRLSAVTEPGSVVTVYSFDDYNNIKAKTVTGGQNPSSIDYSYDKNSRLLTEIQTAGTIKYITRYSYDKNGNQTYKAKETIVPTVATDIENFNLTAAGEGEITVSKDVAFYQYDGFNQVIAATVGGQKLGYTYDGNGLRQTKSLNGATTTHVWDGSNMVLELNGAGSVTGKFIQGINLIAFEDASGIRKYYAFNGHGDIVQLTDVNGSVVKNYDYDAYGNEKSIEANDTNIFRYCGEYFDKEAGNVYLRARYYDPRVGRFISEDTNKGDINNPSSLNLYTYCSGNPIKYIDPSGHVQETYVDGLGGGGGGSLILALYYLFCNTAPEATQAVTQVASYADRIQAASNAANKTAENYNDGSSPNNPDPNKWDKNKSFDKIAKMDKDALWNKYERHIFSRDHVKEGIMNLGESRTDIYNEFVDVVKSEIGNLQSGTTQIRTYINGYQAEVKVNISEGIIRSIDGYVGWSSRVIEHLIVK